MASDALLHALAERILGPANLTSEDVIGDAGAGLEEAEDLWMGLGFHPVGQGNPAFTERDREILTGLMVLRESGFAGPEITGPMTRVLGQALSRVASAQVEAFHDRLVEAAEQVEAGEDADEILGQVADLLVPGFEVFITYTWRRHLVAALRRELSDDRPGETIGFADLVDFTRETRSLEDDSLSDLIDRFQRIASEEVTANQARIVKTLGDGVMYAAPTPIAAARVGLGMVHACDRDQEMLGVRVGLAGGHTISLEGDLYGETVNRASRLSDLARPQTVVADDTVGRALMETGDVTARKMRPRKLKGLGTVPTWAIRPPEV